jgi:hypothetical protein
MSRSSQLSAAACRSKIASRFLATFAASVSRWNIRISRPPARGPLDRKPARGEREQYVEIGCVSANVSRTRPSLISLRSRPRWRPFPIRLGRPSASVQRALRSGWSKHRKPVRACRDQNRAQEIVVAVERGIPASNSIVRRLSPWRSAAAGTTR